MKALIKLLFSFIALCFVSFSASAQNVEWAISVGGKEADWVECITTDDAGFVYKSGTFRVTADFDPGSGTHNLSAGNLDDGFLAKYSPSGKLIWVRTQSTDRGVKSNSVTIDASGDVVLTGGFADSVEFDKKVKNGTLYQKGTKGEVFIAKYDSSGKFLWAKGVASGDHSSYAVSVDTDSSLNIYITGNFRGPNLDFDPGPDSSSPAYNDQMDIFIAKYDSVGNFHWVHGIGSVNTDWASTVAVDNTGKIYLAGYFAGNVDFDPGPKEHIVTHKSDFEIFISKYSTSGKMLWTKTFGGTGNESINDLELDNQANIHIAGYYYSTKSDFDPDTGTTHLPHQGGYADVYFGKYDSSGKFIFIKNVGSKNFERGHDLSVGPAGYITLTGYFTDSIDLDPGKKRYMVGGKGEEDAFVARYNSSGNFVWGYPLTSKGTNHGISAASDRWGNTYVTGTYEDQIDFDPGPRKNILQAVQNLYLAPDIFVQKILCERSISSFSATACYSYLSPDKKTTWTSSGKYVVLLKNSVGCDSVVNVNLTILGSDHDTVRVTACDSFVSPSGKYTWFSSGTFHDTLANVKGCDSIVTFELKLNDTKDTSTFVSACDSFMSPSGKTYFRSGLYQDTISTTSGCDSLIFLNLSILKKTSNTINVITCDSFISPSGKFTWDAFGTYYDTVQNNNGCDSIIEVNLMINKTTYRFDTVQACDEYISPSGKKWTTKGIHIDSVMKPNGCFEITTFLLNLGRTKWFSLDIYTCDSFISPTGKYVWRQSGVYYDTFQSVAGCDSIIKVNLEIAEFNLTVFANNNGFSLVDSGASYSWVECDSSGYTEIPGDTGRSFVPKKTGDYAVKITKADCFRYSSCMYFYVAGLKESANVMRIFPNPTSGKVNIELTEKYRKVRVTVTTIEGKKVRQEDYDYPENIRLNLGGAPGIYFITVDTGNKLYHERVVVN